MAQLVHRKTWTIQGTIIPVRLDVCSGTQFEATFAVTAGKKTLKPQQRSWAFLS
jgi:hypothetical protein